MGLLPISLTARASKVAVENRKRPSILALSRQKLPHLPGTSVEVVVKGGYVISDNSTGDKTRRNPNGDRVGARDSCKGWREAKRRKKSSESSVIARVSIEAGSTFGWEKMVGSKRKAIGVDSFGASAPANVLYRKFGLTVDTVIAAAKDFLLS
ncbi:Transketolase C-terminal/Pyruvate-ferredoxin oxidoreductase domain II [Arabidopsis suecica]|uniref:Transketolase C-terminal/Pyruvate-ferredoxin oxidoreductase domain II n=1 Tax=Arabidopsis suecica TaxID=45249 RepID=A0A8T2EHS9_ARASU|nr:Transketolase C-terminal/Pyruvate-ferredoxin oxidoreductase domain II [Arabidopsis suecica]